MSQTFFPPRSHNGKTLDTWHYNHDYTQAIATYSDVLGEEETITVDVD